MAGEGSALHLVLTAVVDGLRAREGYRDPSAVDDGTGTTVYDGPEWDEGPGEESLLVVGWPGVDGTGELADAGQTQSVLSTAPHRTEVGSVRCLLTLQTGDHEAGTVPALRGQAFAVLDDVARFLRADPSLGLMTTYPHLHAQIGGITGFGLFTAGGAGLVAEIEFEIGYQARI